MDEPLSNLDAKLRVEMRAELKRLQEDLGVTTIYVTHDQAEAMTMADTLIVMRNGVILQSGVPQVLYDTPHCIFVAGFIGSPPMNFLACTYDSSANCLSGDSFTYPVPPRLRPVLETVRQRQVVLGIRPEDIIVNVAPGPGAILARVYMSEPLGRENLLTLQVGSAMLRVLAPPEIQVGLDQMVGLTFPDNRVHIFDQASESSLTIHA